MSAVVKPQRKVTSFKRDDKVIELTPEVIRQVVKTINFLNMSPSSTSYAKEARELLPLLQKVTTGKMLHFTVNETWDIHLSQLIAACKQTANKRDSASFDVESLFGEGSETGKAK